MSTTQTGSFPTAAVDWLSPSRPGEVLAVGAGGPVVRRLLSDGNALYVVDQDPAVLARQRARYPSLRAVMASAHALPFATCVFAAVTVSSAMRELAPGLALAEFARVLVPGGYLAVHHTARDDSVPWVRRLAAILRAVDPSAMSGTGDAAVGIPDKCSFFPRVEERQFRMWVPRRKDDLIADVTKMDSVARLDPSAMAALVADVGQLYDASARAPEPLLLPYTVTCWRAEVDHRGLNASRRSASDGFRITF